jgi:hypothetical protein
MFGIQRSAATLLVKRMNELAVRFRENKSEIDNLQKAIVDSATKGSARERLMWDSQDRRSAGRDELQTDSAEGAERLRAGVLVEAGGAVA